MRTADLEGAHLDYWVAKAQGLGLVQCENGLWLVYAPEPMILGIDRSAALNPAVRYSPSTNWAQAGPIIEAEAIAIFVDRFAYGVNPNRWLAGYELRAENGQEYGTLTGQGEASLELECSANGPTPLIAAMRAFVAAKLGDEVGEAI